MTEERYNLITAKIESGMSERKACDSNAERVAYQKMRKRKLATGGVGIKKTKEGAIVVSISSTDNDIKKPTLEEIETRLWVAIYKGLGIGDAASLKMAMELMKCRKQEYQTKIAGVFTPSDYEELWKSEKTK